MMMTEIRSSETSVLTRTTRQHIPEDGILHIHRRETLKSYIVLTVWTLFKRSNVSPVKYELGFYITEDGILHSHRLEHLKSYIVPVNFLEDKAARKSNKKKPIFEMIIPKM
jgi:hypothetical protein